MRTASAALPGPGTDRDLTHFPNPYTRSESWWLSFALFPQLTWVSQSIQDPARAAEGFSVCSPCSGSALPRRKVSLTFPCAPCSREEYTDLEQCTARGQSSTQDTACCFPPSFRKFVHQHTQSTTPPTPLCLSSSTDPNSKGRLHQDTSHGAVASYYQHPGQLKASNTRLL